MDEKSKRQEGMFNMIGNVTITKRVYSLVKNSLSIPETFSGFDNSEISKRLRGSVTEWLECRT